MGDEAPASPPSGGTIGGVGFPGDILTDYEQVVMDLRPHWVRLVRPVLSGAVVLALAVLGVFFTPAGVLQVALQYTILVVAVVLLAVLTVRPWLIWVTTRYVLTTERVLLSHGIVSRSRRDIPLRRINDFTFEQTLFERLFGSGTLILESAGEHGQLSLLSVPHVEAFHQRLYELGDDRASA
jgi:uncharacterized membrane protein YdbT with pleckstrin-like domain